jgi:hypothetical protein
MNPITKLKQYNQAQAALNHEGYKGDLLEAIGELLATKDALADALTQYNEMARQLQGNVFPVSDATEGMAMKTYFVPYLYQATAFHNGGPPRSGSGMTMVHIAGGVREWKNIVGVMEFIKTQLLAPQNLPNAQVTILGLDEVKP